MSFRTVNNYSSTDLWDKDRKVIISEPSGRQEARLSVGKFQMAE
jgi:hypothetical protein